MRSRTTAGLAALGALGLTASGAIPAVSVAAARTTPVARLAAAHHLVGLRNAGQAERVRRAYGERALFAFDRRSRRFVRVGSFRVPLHSTLYVSSKLAEALHLSPARQRPAAARRHAPATTTTVAPVAKPSAPAPAPAPAAASPGGDPPAPGSWHVVFDDEFGGSTLDTSRWTPYWFSNGSTSNQTTMLASNVSVSGGSLDLALTPTSGALVSTNGKFQFTYGYLEARVYLPASGAAIANWPAFWADGQSWPTDGELDVMEGLGGSACYHFHSDAGGPGGCAPGDFTGWHTYGADWEPGSVTYYYDGRPVGTITSGITSQPMYLILENSSGSYGGPSLRPATMQVDYVRVFQH